MKILKKCKAVRVIAMFLLMSAAIFAGCGEKVKDEDIIKEGVTKELESIKNMDETFMKEMETATGAEELKQFGISPDEFIKAYFKGFDYTVGDIKVEGETAAANVTMKCKSFSGYEAALQKASDELMKDAEKLASLSEEELNTKMGEMIMSTLDKVEVKETQPISLTYELKDRVWTPAADTEEKISEAMLGN